jgi:hypothetical protein
VWARGWERCGSGARRHRVEDGGGGPEGGAGMRVCGRREARVYLQRGSSQPSVC